MMLFLLFVVAATVSAVSLIVIPLVYRRASRDSGDEDLVVLADSIREMDADLEANLISQADYDKAHSELLHAALQTGRARQKDKGSSRRRRTGWLAPLLVGMALPITAVGLYIMNGQPALVPGVLQSGSSGGDMANAQILETIKTLKGKLENDDDNGERWLLLARSYQAAGQSSEGMSAYAKAVSLMPENPDLLIEYANALGRFNNRDLSGTPTALIKTALELDPDNHNALALAGAAAMQKGDTEKAAEHWSHLEQLIPQDSPDRARVAALVARAEGRPVPPEAQSLLQTVSVSAPRDVAGTIVLDDALADRVSPSDTLFVFARVPYGPPMPVAAVRKPAAGWPVTFTLDDSSAMIEGMVLSSFDQIDIVARVSQDGNATPQEGDIEGRVEGISLGNQKVVVVLDRIVSAK